MGEIEEGGGESSFQLRKEPAHNYGPQVYTLQNSGS